MYAERITEDQFVQSRSVNGQGLVHRDLKPTNIFLATVDGNRIAKIGDYASAVASQRLAALTG